MTKALAQIALNGVAILVAAQLIPGIDYSGGIPYLFLAGLVLGAINLLVKPLVTLLSLPMIVLSLGLFFLVINGAMLWLAGQLLSGLTVEGCLPAVLGGVVLAAFNWFLRVAWSERD
jgi:putative membrane protein